MFYLDVDLSSSLRSKKVPKSLKPSNLPQNFTSEFRNIPSIHKQAVNTFVVTNKHRVLQHKAFIDIYCVYTVT